VKYLWDLRKKAEEEADNDRTDSEVDDDDDDVLDTEGAHVGSSLHRDPYAMLSARDDSTSDTSNQYSKSQTEAVDPSSVPALEEISEQDMADEADKQQKKAQIDKLDLPLITGPRAPDQIWSDDDDMEEFEDQEATPSQPQPLISEVSTTRAGESRGTRMLITEVASASEDESEEEQQQQEASPSNTVASSPSPMIETITPSTSTAANDTSIDSTSTGITRLHITQDEASDEFKDDSEDEDDEIPEDLPTQTDGWMTIGGKSTSRSKPTTSLIQVISSTDADELD
jgi:hypothetical protein